MLFQTSYNKPAYIYASLCREKTSEMAWKYNTVEDNLWKSMLGIRFGDITGKV